MRGKLAAIDGKRALFRATFEREGGRTSHGHFVPMFLFVDVSNVHGQEVCDHVWFRQTKGMKALALQPGDEVQFEARVGAYWKGYIDRERDYCLKFPTRLRKWSPVAPELVDLPLFALAKPA